MLKRQKAERVRKLDLKTKTAGFVKLQRAAKKPLWSALWDTWWITSRNLLLLQDCWTVSPQRPPFIPPGRYTASTLKSWRASAFNYTEYGNSSSTVLMDLGYIFCSDNDGRLSKESGLKTFLWLFTSSWIALCSPEETEGATSTNERVSSCQLMGPPG